MPVATNGRQTGDNHATCGGLTRQHEGLASPQGPELPQALALHPPVATPASWPMWPPAVTHLLRNLPHPPPAVLRAPPVSLPPQGA